MKKNQLAIRDRGLVSLTLLLPEGPDENILMLNPFLATAKFMHRDTGEYVPVFPLCRQEKNHWLVAHTVRVGWFNSPHRMEPDFEKRCLQAAKAAGFAHEGARPDDLPLKARGTALSRHDIFFEEGSLSRKYLDNFLEYQKHPIWEFYNKASQLLSKQNAFYRDLRMDGENTKLLQEMREFTSGMIQWMEAMSQFHQDMVYKVYYLDDLAQHVKVRNVGSEAASAASLGDADLEDDEVIVD